MNWQPADTAPKTGEEILAWPRELGGPIVLFWANSKAGWIDGLTPDRWTLLHWMPLPPPPVD